MAGSPTRLGVGHEEWEDWGKGGSLGCLFGGLLELLVSSREFNFLDHKNIGSLVLKVMRLFLVSFVSSSFFHSFPSERSEVTRVFFFVPLCPETLAVGWFSTNWNVFSCNMEKM